MAKSNDYPADDRDVEEAEDKACEIMECPICLQICIHPSKLPCGHIFCFLCVKGLKNRRCAMCRTEFPIEFLEKPELLRPISSTPSPAGIEQSEHKWFYKGRNGWWQYDERTCQEIEDAYTSRQKECTILVAGYLYVVDFEQMLQQRQTDPLRKRQVKRDLANIPKKGVAGLRFLNSADAEPASADDTAPTNSNSSNLIATIAATEAAIRIASDIIGSTLAHVDDYNEARNGVTSMEQPLGTTSDAANAQIHAASDQDTYDAANSGSSAAVSNRSDTAAPYNRRDMLEEIEETFNITNLSSINSALRSSSSYQDLFSVTLDEFRNLTLNNIVEDSSSDDNNDADHLDEINFSDSCSTENVNTLRC